MKSKKDDIESQYNKISIITVCRNSENTIEQTINSVLNQTFQDYQYIIIDGGSTDSTLDVIRRYENRFRPGRLKLLSEPDTGIYNAMNKGIRLAEGELIGIINSDDWYEKDALEHAWNIYERSNRKECIIYGALRYYSNDREERVAYYRHEFIPDRMIAHPACFVSRTIYNKIGLFDESYRIAADYDFMWRALEKGVHFEGENIVLANFRMGGASETGDAAGEVLRVRYRHGYFNSREYKIKMLKHKLKYMVHKGELALRIVRR